MAARLDVVGFPPLALVSRVPSYAGTAPVWYLPRMQGRGGFGGAGARGAAHARFGNRVILLMAMKRPGTGALIAVLFGAVSLMNMALNGRLEALRAVDVVQLIGTGMCFGAAIVGIVTILRRGR